MRRKNKSDIITKFSFCQKDYVPLSGTNFFLDKPHETKLETQKEKRVDVGKYPVPGVLPYRVGLRPQRKGQVTHIVTKEIWYRVVSLRDVPPK